MEAYVLLPIWKKGKDSKKPSMRPIRIPLEPAKTISASLEGPSRARRTNSASLEGSGSTLERVTHLRLARG